MTRIYCIYIISFLLTRCADTGLRTPLIRMQMIAGYGIGK